MRPRQLHACIGRGGASKGAHACCCTLQASTSEWAAAGAPVTMDTREKAPPPRTVPSVRTSVLDSLPEAAGSMPSAPRPTPHTRVHALMGAQQRRQRRALHQASTPLHLVVHGAGQPSAAVLALAGRQVTCRLTRWTHVKRAPA